MRAEEIKGLMEAYSKVHETPEVLSEETEQLDEAPMTAFQAAGGQAKLDQLNKGRGPRSGRVTARDIERQGQENLFRAGGGNAAISKGPTRTQNVRGGSTRQVPTLTRQDIINRGTVAAAKPAKPAAPAATKPAAPAATKPAAPAATKPAAPAATKPAAPAAAKPAATTAPKPTTPAAPAKPAGSAMDQWAKANPKLAAAKAERDRTRGTSATTNPLMKDMKDKLPAPKSPSPSTASTAFGLAKKGVNLAAGVDIFDLVKGHLLDEGYAETEEGAMVIMVNMSEEWRKSILEAHGVELDELELDESSKTDDGTRERIRMYAGKKGISFEPGPRWDPSANRGKGANLSDKQIEKQRRKSLRKEDLEAWVDQLIAEGYDLSEYTWEEVAEIYAEELQLMELTGGKGHPGYKAGSKDHGDLEDHPAVKKGGVLTPRHGEHLGDLDDEDDEDDELENIIRDRSRARREAVRKPLRDKVKAARKKMTKEETSVTIEDIVKLLDENREHDREMRKAAARERAEEKKERKEEGKKSAKAPGRLGKSAGSSYADYQELSIKSHDKMTKGKYIPGMVKNEEVELVDESALGTMAVLGGMAAGRAIHGKLQKRKAKKELEAKRKTSDYLIMKDKTKKAVARDRAASGDTRKEDLEAWVDELIAEGYDLSGYTWEEVAEIYAQELELMDEASYSAKAARAGKDIGKPGKTFAKIAKEAGERYGSKERGEKVAGAVLAKLRKEGYQRDPEKGEEKEDKKYENVRGEKTPMPPRGDKRRESFEKWYAKQMGR